MVDTKFTDLPEDTTPASNDFVNSIDVSDTTDDPAGSSKKTQLSNLGKALTIAGISDVTITSIASGEVLKWNGSAWINNTLAELGVLELAGGTMTGAINLDDNNLENVKVANFNVVDDGNSSTADTIDWTTGAFHKSTMTDDVTYTFTDPFAGGTDDARLELKLVQDATGGRDAIWPAKVIWPEGEPTWTDGTSNQTLRITFVYDDEDDQYVGQATSWY